MTLRRVVVTGIGTINPLGHNVAEYFENLEKGGPISIADRFITNNGTAEELVKAVKDYMNEI